MPRVPLISLLLLLSATARAAEVFVIADTTNETRAIAQSLNESVAEATDDALKVNDTLSDSDHEPVVRKKRTFGDIVFRGLADVLGYKVARKPPQAFEFPPPVAPVPGIDSPLQAGPAPAPPAPAAPAAPPCGAPRAAAPPPCRARRPPPPPTPPPCAKPRANPPKPKPTKPPAPRPPPPCGAPRANPTTAAPCAPAPPPKADSNLETINTNFRLNLNFNRGVAAPTATAAEDETVADYDAPLERAPIDPIAIQPRAAKLPPPAPRNSRVYIDAFVLRDGIAQKVNTVDALNFKRDPVAHDDYLFYEDEEPQTQRGRQDYDDDYEDVEDPRARSGALRKVGTAVDQFWSQKQKPNQKLPLNDYRNVHFGDRELTNQIRRRNDDGQQGLQSDRKNPKRIPQNQANDSDGEEESEVTTTTQDPRRKLKPRVLPPTEHNPNQIDTVTVRVPPIYKEKRPKKLHRETPEAPDRDEEAEGPPRAYEDDESDAESEQSSQVERTEAPKRKRRRKKSRRARATSGESYTAGDYDYYGNKLPVSEEEERYGELTVPPPTKDADVARLEDAGDEGHFLDDHERLQEDPERIRDSKSSKEKDSGDRDRTGEGERSDDSERSEEETERADEQEKTDTLSPNARVRESGYQNKYVRAHNVQVDAPRPHVAVVRSKNTVLRKP
ncbi:unnamed protein product [Leptosia nina]|uniref:Uncharacterized protein n=1 Tax=Leptosia nina TaxID=320188 RepID=A0AAV1J2J8_9NEOP